ncbi:BTAD domain-containing putative transcriptional regulator [Actinomadura parmotrematis]|uniref:Winged helix-turn-helix domain-containing protein n=1 Tax=Actinomadura parmotrematis TaxID=2864039 RepID=A0ABS7FZZ7_9ACTN|nr:BTAD domain-containing putative transcriptional regulator [Actinomadura parmotrematis]MBW8485520.1 winged helix-turn-helix domain-containing protein [Actinomadura parmotrematis]
MRVGILGPVEVWGGDGAISVGGPRVRALLALLALDAGRLVTNERLIDGLYGEEPPAGAANALQSQVSRLRRGLGDASLVEGQAAGYRLVLDRDAVDAHRFERLAQEGRRALDAGQARRAGELFEEALGLWRGAALADVPFAEGQARRLEELRVAVVEDWAEASLDRPGEVVARLQGLVAEHPLRERARGLLMRALCAAGRQAEALEVFEDARRVLADELGADPSAELAEVHLAILRGDVGAPKAAAENRLPAPLTSFVGREDELRRLGAMLGESRLVTLLGPGGTGKTRLAVEAAAREAGEVRMAELAAVRDAADVARAVADAVGLRDTSVRHGPGDAGPGVEERLVTALEGRALLLVVDNCEHVIEAVARLVRRLLTGCPRLRILATSREALGITGEALRPLPPLALPPEGAVEPGELLASPAVRLFADRAAAVRPGFAVDAAVAADVRRICAALDGLPLAIELAAARLRSLPVGQVAARLDDRFRLLSRGDRTALPRHRTLRAVVEWSWDLLDEDERALARRLTVFAGGFTLEAAERVCGADDLVLELADKSLLHTDGVRFRMLETIRAFCAERLEESGELAALERRHAEHFLEVAADADPRLRAGDQLDALALLAADHADLHTALRRAIGFDAALALRLVAVLSWYWWLRGRTEGAELSVRLMEAVDLDPPEGLEEEYVMCVANALSGRSPGARAAAWLDRATELGNNLGRRLRHPSAMVLWALAAGPERTDPEAFMEQIGQDPWSQAVMEMSYGFLAQFRGDLDAAAAACETALTGFRALGDRWGIANSLDPLAQVADWRGEHERALRLLDEALALATELGAQEDQADLRSRRAEVLVRAGELEAARAEYATAIAHARRAGAPDKISGGHVGLATIARLEGDLATARRLYATALADADTERFLAESMRAAALTGLGWVAAAEGDRAEARRRYREALATSRDHPVFEHRSAAAIGLAADALLDGAAERAALLLGGAVQLRGTPMGRDPDTARVTAEVRAALGDAAFEEARARGAALPVGAVLALLHED